MTEYKKTVKKRLIDLEKNTEWLANEVNARTGLHCDRPYVSKVMSGVRHSPRVTEAINQILGIEVNA